MAKSIKPRSNEYYRANAHRIVLYLKDVAGGVYTLLAREAKGTGVDREVAIVALLLSAYPELLGYICASLDMSRGERAANPPKKAKPTYTVKVGNLGALHKGTSKTEAEIKYGLLCRSSMAGDQAGLLTGSDVTLYRDGKILARHHGHGSKRKPNHHRTGILSEDYPMDPYRRDLAKAYDPYDAYWRSPNGRRANAGGSDYEIYEADIPGQYSVVYVGDPKGRYRLKNIQSNGYGYEGGIKPIEYARIKKRNRRLSLSDLPPVVRAVAEKYMGLR